MPLICSRRPLMHRMKRRASQLLRSDERYDPRPADYFTRAIGLGHIKRVDSSRPLPGIELGADDQRHPPSRRQGNVQLSGWSPSPQDAKAAPRLKPVLKGLMLAHVNRKF